MSQQLESKPHLFTVQKLVDMDLLWGRRTIQLAILCPLYKQASFPLCKNPFHPRRQTMLRKMFWQVHLESSRMIKKIYQTILSYLLTALTAIILICINTTWESNGQKKIFKHAKKAYIFFFSSHFAEGKYWFNCIYSRYFLLVRLV